jgi:hypothetical protein
MELTLNRNGEDKSAFAAPEYLLYTFGLSFQKEGLVYRIFRDLLKKQQAESMF